jgi:membrane-associated phospholipid phosphatase
MVKNILFLMVFLVSKLSAQEVAPPPADQEDDANVPAQTLKDARPNKVYHMNYKVVVPIIAVGFAVTAYDFSVIYKKTATPVATILALNRNNIPVFDRWVSYNHDLNMDKISYYPFYAVMPLPLILLFDKKIRKDAGTVGLMYLEAFAFTGVVYGSSVFFVDRYRPDVYNTSLDMSYRTEGNYRNSFFAGHVAVVATSTFFIAKVFDDYHPESNWKWAVYGGAAAATIGMGYMRLEAGKHFLSDVVIGAAVGTFSGILTPALHKNKYKKQAWSLQPSVMEKGPGFAFTYKL